MKTRSNSRHFILLSSMLIGVIDVHAQAVDKPCVELNSEAKLEQLYTDAQGKKSNASGRARQGDTGQSGYLHHYGKECL
jgi:hypothetical protein